MARVVGCKVVWRAAIGKQAVCCLLGLGERWLLTAIGACEQAAARGNDESTAGGVGRCSTDNCVLHGAEEAFQYGCIARARMTQGMVVFLMEAFPFPETRRLARYELPCHPCYVTTHCSSLPDHSLPLHRIPRARASQTREPSL